MLANHVQTVFKNQFGYLRCIYKCLYFPASLLVLPFTIFFLSFVDLMGEEESLQLRS